MPTLPESPPVAPTSHPSAADRLLLFDLGCARYALPLEAVSGLAPCGPVRRVPAAPDAVIGLTQWRGTLLTVLDLPRLVGRPTPGPTACLVRLAPPHEQTALFLPATVRVTPGHSVSTSISADRREVQVDGTPYRLLCIHSLIRRVEAETRQRS